MSFRDLRNFTELMRALGYPRLISVENFRTPNFALVADSLYWLVHRYDPHLRISDDIETEDDRVHFLTQIVQVMASRAQVTLNPRRLYAADGRAVKELLKIARLLYKAQTANTGKKEGKGAETGGDEDEEDESFAQAKLAGIQNTRKLASDITESGAKLFDLLQYEEALRRQRDDALRFLDASASSHTRTESDFIEKSIRHIINSLGENVAALEKQCSDLEQDEKNLEKRIKKKKQDLERSEKRLKSLQTVRPAFMDEFDKQEAELKRQYEIYLERFRNLDYLEHQLDLHNQAEREKLESAEKTLKRMQDRLRQQDERLTRGNDMSGMSKANNGYDGGGGDSRPNASYRQYREGGGGGGIRGSMTQASSESESESVTNSDDSRSNSDDWDNVSLGSDKGSVSDDVSVDDDIGDDSDSDDALSMSDDDSMGGSGSETASSNEF